MIILNSVYPPGPLWLIVIALGLKNSPNPNSERYLLSSHPELYSLMRSTIGSRMWSLHRIEVLNFLKTMTLGCDLTSPLTSSSIQPWVGLMYLYKSWTSDHGWCFCRVRHSINIYGHVCVCLCNCVFPRQCDLISPVSPLAKSDLATHKQIFDCFQFRNVSPLFTAKQTKAASFEPKLEVKPYE